MERIPPMQRPFLVVESELTNRCRLRSFRSSASPTRSPTAFSAPLETAGTSTQSARWPAGFQVPIWASRLSRRIGDARLENETSIEGWADFLWRAKTGQRIISDLLGRLSRQRTI